MTISFVPTPAAFIFSLYGILTRTPRPLYFCLLKTIHRRYRPMAALSKANTFALFFLADLIFSSINDMGDAWISCFLFIFPYWFSLWNWKRGASFHLRLFPWGEILCVCYAPLVWDSQNAIGGHRWLSATNSSIHPFDDYDSIVAATQPQPPIGSSLICTSYEYRSAVHYVTSITKRVAAVKRKKASWWWCRSRFGIIHQLSL